MLNIYNTYTNNKRAYINLSQQHDYHNDWQHGGKLNPKYYAIHNTNFKNLIEILKSNSLKSNNNIDKKYWRISGETPKDYIFTSLVRSGDAVYPFGIGLIFDEKIFHDNSFAFNIGWIGHITNKTIIIDPKNQTKTSISKELENMYDMIPPKNVPQHNEMNHEILFFDELSLNHLIGIHCPFRSKYQIRKIKKYLNNQAVIIYTNEYFYINL